MPPSTRSSSAPKAPQKADPAPAKPAGGAKGRKGGAKEDEGKDATKPKKRKTGGKQGKGKAEEVLEMGRDVFSTLPMDLVLQICSDVDPGTLLAIGQTSKSICSTLFRKAAEPVWLAASRNVGMPDLQAEMDEPTYAYLVQGKACQVCGTTRLKTEAEHELRVCACSKCMTANLRNASRIRNEMEDLHPLALECCLSTPYSAAGNTRADEEHYFWVPEVAAVSDHLDAIDSPPKPENDDEQEPEYSPNDDAQLFREECRQRKVKVSADAATIFKYESRSLDENLAEEKRKIEARMAQIRDRLIAAGFVAQEWVASVLTLDRC
ncbi:RHTO0S13e01200g1_1 [Rhodotorula toruloides]|uniref:RHTO0S13e01200g1_1 n=1 Tax=Rhodotorula toruloides TaxID=5286 RepID=A0A061B9Z5_RHOTO|nr:RHTO0S13e01200g1_1 [Rhodotorula toruloides]